MNKLSLPSLDTSSKIAYYRLWSGQQVIGIWQNNDGTIAGQLTTWADEVVPDHEKPTNRTFIQTKKLNPDTAKQIQQLFVSSNILSLPTEDSIKGWQRGWDGITYFIEYSTRNKYSFKSYWTPAVQDSLMEARQVQSFVDSVFLLANASKIYKNFEKKIPYEMYRIDEGPMVALRALTKKERRKYARDRKKYRRHLHRK